MLIYLFNKKRKTRSIIFLIMNGLFFSLYLSFEKNNYRNYV